MTNFLPYITIIMFLPKTTLFLGKNFVVGDTTLSIPVWWCRKPSFYCAGWSLVGYWPLYPRKVPDIWVVHHLVDLNALRLLAFPFFLLFVFTPIPYHVSLLDFTLTSFFYSLSIWHKDIWYFSYVLFSLFTNFLIPYINIFAKILV